MKPFFILLLIAFLGFVPSPRQDDAVFKKLHLLEGTWIMKTPSGAIGEEWKKTDAAHLHGRGFQVRGKDTVLTEQVELKNIQHTITYTSTVEDQNDRQPVSFKLISAANQQFVFVNPRHDYPKRVTYRFISNDSIHAWIDDGTDRPAKKSAFHYHRQY